MPSTLSTGCSMCNSVLSDKKQKRESSGLIRADCHYHDHHRSLSSRFSSGDLSSELDDEPSTDSGLASMARDSSQSYQGVPERPLQSQPTPVPATNQPPVPGAPPPGAPPHGAPPHGPPPHGPPPHGLPPHGPPPPGPPQPVGGDLSLNLRPGSRTTSAPSSPAKTRESLLQRVQSLTGAARDQVRSRGIQVFFWLVQVKRRWTCVSQVMRLRLLTFISSSKKF